MRIINFKNYVDWKNIKKKFALVAISVAIGSMATGWIIDSGSKYYLNEDGTMQTKDKTIDGKKYRFNKSGAVII